MALPDYSYLSEHACERKGGEKVLKALLPKTKSKAQLKKLGSDRYLAELEGYWTKLFDYLIENTDVQQCEDSSCL